MGAFADLPERAAFAPARPPTAFARARSRFVGSSSTRTSRSSQVAISSATGTPSVTSRVRERIVGSTSCALGAHSSQIVCAEGSSISLSSTFVVRSSMRSVFSMMMIRQGAVLGICSLSVTRSRTSSMPIVTLSVESVTTSGKRSARICEVIFVGSSPSPWSGLSNAAANARAKERVAELQDFVRRFSANKSKARQAKSRAKQIDKIKIEEFKPSSRQNPFIRFEFEKKLHNIAVVADTITKKYERTIFQNFNLSVQPGKRIAIIGENGAGKTTLLRSLLGSLELDHGTVKWAENANVGYMPQDTYEEFPNDITLMDWIDQYRKDGDDETMVRGTLGRLLFSADDIKKSVKVLSGGEKGRMIWGKLMLGRHNVLLMDEPTNHMDMESIESLQIALEKFEGTLIFVSHDREFVSGLANRVIEVKTDGTLLDFGGNYEDFLASQGQA